MNGSTRPLPVRVLPLPDELLSCWFVRLSHGNAEKAQSLAFRIWGRVHQFIGVGDPDRGDRTEILEALELVTKVPQGRLAEMTVSAYRGLLWNDVGTLGCRRWVLPVVDRQHKRKRYGLQACPECLKEDRTPYFRRTWRLSLHCLCVKHQRVLIDRCAECGEPIMVHRGDIGAFVPEDGAGLRHCAFCNADFAEVRPPPVPDIAALDFQRLLLTTLHRGWVNVGGRVIYSALFFEGIRMLWSFLDAPRWSMRLRQHLQDCNVLQQLETARAERYGGFDMAPVEDRLGLLQATAWLMEDWPERFLSSMQKANLASYPLLHFRAGDPDSVPFWLWEPVHHHLDRTMYVPSGEEIEAAISHLACDGRIPPVRDVCKLLNMRTHYSARIAAVCLSFGQKMSGDLLHSSQAAQRKSLLHPNTSGRTLVRG